MALQQVGVGENLWTYEKHYTLRQVATRQVRKFNTSSTDNLLTLNPQTEQQPLIDQLGKFLTLWSMK